jgi:hypothetical protein
MMTQRTYPTLLRNNRKKELVVMDNQITVTTLFPGEERTIEAVEPWSFYARYESVAWHLDGSVDAVIRDDWHEPARGKYVLKALNVDGKDYHPVILGGRPYNLPRGIPVLVAVEITDPLVTYQSLEIKRVERWVPEVGWPGYIQSLAVLEEVKTERPGNELAKIQAELELLEQKSVEVQA